MNINYITLAQNLQRLMEYKNVDRYKLCDDLGFKYATVSSWLNATKYPRVEKLDILANYFDVPKIVLTEQWHFQFEELPYYLKQLKKDAPIIENESDEIKEIKKKLDRLSDSDVIKLSDFIDYLLSRREKRTDTHSV